MRTAIRNQLCSEVSAFEGRVYQPSMPGPQTKKPYAVVKMGTENPANISMAFNKPVEIWVYADKNDFTELDMRINEVIRALHGTELTAANGEKFELRYQGYIGSEYYDEEWKATTQALEFETVAIYEGR